MQTYDNWMILIRDDMSTDSTTEVIRNVCRRWNIGMEHYPDPDGERTYVTGSSQKVKLVTNKEKFWEVRNVLEMINDSHVREDDIICRLDGDDFLCDLCALQDLNAVYNSNQKVGCVWTAHRWADTLQNISGPLPEGADPYKHPWVTSHLKTFRKKLFTPVSDANFRGPDGEYIKRAGDQAIYLPVLWRAREDGYKSIFFPKLTYYYTIDMKPETFQTDDAKFQKQEADFLRLRGYV